MGRESRRAGIKGGKYYPGVTGYCKLGLEVARDVIFASFARRITYLQSAKAPIFRYYFSRRAKKLSTGAMSPLVTLH